MKKALTLLLLTVLTFHLKAQEIDITGKNISIASGATGTTRNNNTDFGEQISASGSISKTFSITNSGTSNLSVSSITSNNADFTISGFTSGTIPPGGAQGFTVVFNPSSNATITGSITVNNNDANEGTYVFRVTGLGLASRTVRWVNNVGATRPASVTLSGDSYSTAPATYTNITLAINAAVAYDIIYVTDGRYKNPSEPSSTNCNIGNNSIQDGNLYINVNKSNLIITSETGDYTTSNARIVGYSFNLTNTSGNITIQGLAIDSVRQNAFYNTDISSGPTPNIRILRNKITNVRGHGIKTDTRYFNTIDRGAWEINGNYFENIGYYQSGTCTGTLNSSAMWLGEAGSSYEIMDNTIINPKWAGILCDGFGNPNGSANGALTIYGNKISNTGNAGIQIGWSSTTNPSLLTPNRAFIVNNALVNVNTSSATSVGAITMLQSNLLGVTINSNQVTSSWNGLVINIAGWTNRGDTAECRFNNFCNIKSGSYAIAHQSGVSPNVLGNVSDNLFLYKFAYNYYGASSGPTYSTNFTGSGAALFRSTTTTTSGAFYSLNTFSTTNVAPFRTSPNYIPVTNAGPISGTTTPCAGSTQIYSITAVGGATSYVWSIPSGWSGSSTTNSISVTTNTASGTISVYAVNACTSTPATSLVVTTGALPNAPGTIAGNGNFCLNVGRTLSVSPVSGASSYFWNLPSGFSGSSSTNTISVTPTSNLAFGTITVAAVNNCGTSSNTTAFLLTVNSPTVTASSGTICSGDSFTISPGGASTYTYSSGSNVVSPTANTSYSITGTNGSGCVSSNTAVITVSVLSTPTISVNSGSICSGKSFTMVPSGASTYTFSSGSSVVSPLSNTSYSVTGTGTNGCESTNTAVCNVTVNASPTITVNSGGVCSGNSFTITPSGANTYTISGGSSIVAPTTNTSYNVTGTGTNGCVSSNTAVSSVSINASPTITVNSGGICSGNSFTISPGGANTYTISGGSFTVSPTTSTVYNVTGTGTNGCVSSNTAVSSVSINPSPTVVVNSGGVCPGNSFTINATGASTYTYSSGSSIISPSTNTTINVTGTGTNGCVSSNTAVSSISINPTPTISVNSGSICSGLSFTIVPSGASSYTISGGSSVVAPSTNTSYNVTGTGTNGCVSSNTAVSSVTVNISPTITVNNATICSGNSATLSPSGASSYTFSGGSAIVSPTSNTSYNVTGTGTNGCLATNTAVSSVSVNVSPTISVNSGSICSGSSFTINPTGAGTYTFSSGSAVVAPSTNTNYNVTGTGTNGCLATNTAVSSVSVNASPTITVNSGSICSGNSFTMSPSGATSYTFSNGSAIASPTSSASYSVTGTSALGCIGTNTAVSSVTVNITPTLSVNSGSICSGNSFTINASGALTYTYSGGSNTVNPTTSTNYTITGTSAQGCTASAVVSSITVDATPTISVSNGTICSGQSFTLLPGGASSYTYSSGSSVVSPTSTASYSITGSSAAGCISSNTAVAAVAVNTLPVISVNSGTICSGTSFTLSPSGASSYTYQGGSAVVSPTSNTSYTVSGTSANGCVSGTAAVAQVTVFALPTLSLSGGSICPGNNFTLSPSGAATYTYLNGGPILTPTITTSYSVTGTSSVGCPAANTVVAIVTVTNTLVVSITGSANICSGNEATLTANGASTYSWSTGITTPSIGLSPLVNTTYTVYGVSGTCSNNAIVTITVNTTPTISIAGSNSLCSGNSVALTASGANTYSWNTGATATSISPSPTINTTYSVVGTSTNGCSSSTSQAVSVFSVPVISVNSGSICSGNSFTINPSGSNTYTYSSGGAVVTPSATSAYTVTGTSVQGCTASPVVSNVTVNITPTVSVNNGTICSGQIFTLNPGGALTYTLSNGSNTVSPTSNTSYSVTGTSAAGCISSNTAVSAVVVNTLPVISVNSGSICSGNSFTLNASGASSYTYQGGSAVVSPTSNSSYTVSGTSSQGCVSATTAISNVTVFALPTLSLSGGSICPGNNFTLSPSGAATYTYLNGGPTVTPGVTTSYSVTGTSSVGCPASNTVVAVVTVTNTLAVGVTGSANICSGNSASLTANGASTYSWSNGVNTSSISLSPTVNTTYTVYGVSGTCSNNAVIEVTVNTTPTVSIAGSNSLCAGNSITLSASGSTSYSWSTGSTSSSITVNPGANSVYSVTGSNTTGCSAAAIQTVTVYSLPTISVNSGSICSGNSFTILPTGANTYSFSSGGAVQSPSVTSSYTVTGTSTAGCQSFSGAVSTISVFATPTVAASNGTICAGDVFTLNPTGAFTYTYSGGSQTVSPTSNQSYSITGTSTAGCVSSNTAVLAITVNTLPIISVNSGSICAGNSFIITPSGANTYTVSGGSFTVSPVTNSSYSVSGTGTNGCTNTTAAVAQVTVNALPTLSLSGGAICPGNSFTLSPSGAGTYTYLNGGPVVSPGVTTTYSVTGTSTAGCPASNTITAIVTVTNTLAVGITGSAVICSGQSATLTGTGASTYSWSSGANTSTVSLNPLVNTTYTVFGVSGTCSNNAVVTVTVNTTPTVSIAGSSTLCAGSSVSYSASGANSYSWSTSASTSTISVSPASSTIYSVVGTSTNGCSNSAVVSSTVFVLPTITVNSGSICSGQVFTINPNGANTYTYSNGSSTVSPLSNSVYTVTGTSIDGCLGAAALSSVSINASPTISVNSGSICAGQSFVIVPTGAANYLISGGSATVSPINTSTYSVSGTSSLGCNSTNTAICTVSVIAIPNLTITTSSASVCAGNSATLNVSGASGYTWSTNSNATSITVTPSGITNYSVIGVNAAGCSNTSSLSIGNFPEPTVNITSSSASVCAGFSSTLTASGAQSYSWSTGATNSVTTVSPLANTIYSVIGTDLNGCVAGSSISIALNPMPTVAIVSASPGVCNGFTTSLVASGAASYSWNTGATTSVIVVSPTVNTTYTVTGSSGAGCVSTQIATITAYASPSINIGADVEISLGSGLQFTPSQTACVTYSWNPPDYLSSTSIINPVTTPLNDITYTLTGLSANGCKTQDTVNVKVLTKLKIANYMSPNGDGKNDTWKVNSPSLIKDYSILIIDSYNQTVYTKDNNYNNEFDGKRNGENLPDGVYYYFIKDGNTVKYKGSITITK